MPQKEKETQGGCKASIGNPHSSYKHLKGPPSVQGDDKNFTLNDL